MITAPMFRVLLRQQFILQQTELVALTVLAGLAAPGALWMARVLTPGWSAADRLLSANAPFALLSVPLAIITGLLLVARPYIADAQSRHTYVRSLPIPRRSYALLRVATGLTLALLPIVGFGIGTMLAVASTALPESIYAYPVGVTLRFTLATLVAFALSFALQYGAGRHAARVAVVAIIVLGTVELANGLFFDSHLTEAFWRAIVSDSSPLGLYASEWMLFDV
jgi:hypothetical protein